MFIYGLCFLEYLFNEHNIAIQFEFYQKLQVFLVSTADYFEIHFRDQMDQKYSSIKSVKFFGIFTLEIHSS